MEIRQIKNKIRIEHTLKKGEMFKIQKLGKYESFTIFRKPIQVQGFSNVCEDGKQILVLDYDNVDYSVIEEDYKAMQGLEGSLGQAYLFKTSKGYHVISLIKLNSFRIFELLSKTRCDANYVTMPLRNPYRSYVIRISTKGRKNRPRFLKVIGDRASWNEHTELSLAHFNLLKRLYPKIPQIIGYYDKLKKVRIQTYETTE